MKGKQYIICNVAPGLRLKQTNESNYTVISHRMVIPVTTTKALTLYTKKVLTVLVFDQLLFLVTLFGILLYEMNELMSEPHFVCLWTCEIPGLCSLTHGFLNPSQSINLCMCV